MKKFCLAALVVVLVVCSVFCCAACDNGKSDVEGTMRLVLDTDTPIEYTVDLKAVNVSKGLVGVLEFLRASIGLDYSLQESEYGAFLINVGDVKPNADKGEYIYLYTTVESDADVSQWAQKKEYRGVTLTSSGVGAGSMKIKDGCVIMISTIVY